jgi:hypothetical protein
VTGAAYARFGSNTAPNAIVRGRFTPECFTHLSEEARQTLTSGLARSPDSEHEAGYFAFVPEAVIQET